MSLYVFISDIGERHADLAERFETFTDVRPSRPPLAERQIAIVSFAGDAVDAVGRMTHGRKAVSFKWRVRVDELVVLDDPLEVQTLLRALPPAIRAPVNAAFAPPGAQLPDRLVSAVFEATVDFPHPGGRRAQRAYFDAVRDLLAPFYEWTVLRVPAPECDATMAAARLSECLARLSRA